MTLHLYFARRFLLIFLAIMAIFFAIMVLADLAEQVRRYPSDVVSFSQAFELTLLNVPTLLYRILPLIMILATLTLFLNLARTSELVVTRAAGRSALKSLAAPIGVALLIGALALAFLNPMVAATSKQYETLQYRYANGTESVLSISAEGLWLRQGSRTSQTVIRASRANLDGTKLFDVTFIAFAPGKGPTTRIDAKTAELAPGAWQLTEAKKWDISGSKNPERDAVTAARMNITTDLTRAQIRDSFGTPSIIPIWELPAFIRTLEAAGFSARQHRMWFQMELALPFFLVAMVLIGATFTLRHTRFGNTGVMVLSALLTGFGLYFVRNFAQVLGENGQIPILLAAWTPPVAAIGLALGLLLHLEDG